jgi:hypothetical protein
LQSIDKESFIKFSENDEEDKDAKENDNGKLSSLVVDVVDWLGRLNGWIFDPFGVYVLVSLY